jgi:hypothetical protein
MNPSVENGADLAFLAPTLQANNLLEIGEDSKENCFLILIPNVEAYDNKCVQIINYLKIGHILDYIYLRTISEENPIQNTD